MLVRHHEDTRNLETRQQRSVHDLRSDQITKQHDTELAHQEDYTKRSHSELRKKHAMQLRQQPKSLKVRVTILKICFIEVFEVNNIIFGLLNIK